MAEIIAKVISQKGTCDAGHKTGDEFIIGQTTLEGMCSWAFHTLFPFAEVLRFGGAFP
ncbi:TIGR04076 family protein [Chloroflexota bacterium]